MYVYIVLSILMNYFNRINFRDPDAFRILTRKSFMKKENVCGTEKIILAKINPIKIKCFHGYQINTISTSYYFSRLKIETMYSVSCCAFKSFASVLVFLMLG